MKSHIRIALLVSSFLAGQIPVLSHHSLGAEFDRDRHMLLTGRLTRVEWGNPHAWCYIDVRDDATGKAQSWALQLPSPNMFARQGWTREPFKAGIVVTVNGHPAKDGSRKLSAENVTSSAGRKLFSSLSDQTQ